MISVVRTCNRCGVRSERRVRTVEDIQYVVLLVHHTVANPDGGDGCPGCDPEIAARWVAQGVDMDTWRKSVELAHNLRRGS
jgi:hypothetical protein